MQPARAPARKTAQRGVGASSGTPETCGGGASAQVRRCAVRVGTPGPWYTCHSHRCTVGGPLSEPPCASGTCAMQEAGTRIPCMRHDCGMAHLSTQPGTVVITFLYSANAGIVIPTWLGLGHRGTDLQRRGEPCCATQCTLAIRHAMHALCPLCHPPWSPWRSSWTPSHTISNYLELSQSDLERR